MPKESVPAFPKLLVHQAVNIMKMNCLERFQELVGSMEKARAFLDGERADIFQAYTPDAFQFRVLHERCSHLAQSGGRGVLGSESGNPCALMHLQREV